MVGTLEDINRLAKSVSGGISHIHFFLKKENNQVDTFGRAMINLLAEGLDPKTIVFRHQSATFDERQRTHRQHGDYFPYSITFFVPKFRWEVTDLLETLRIKDISIVFANYNCKYFYIKNAKISWKRSTNAKLGNPEGFTITIKGAHHRPIPEIYMSQTVQYWTDPNGEFYQDNNTGLNWIAL